MNSLKKTFIFGLNIFVLSLLFASSLYGGEVINRSLKFLIKNGEYKKANRLLINMKSSGVDENIIIKWKNYIADNKSGILKKKKKVLLKKKIETQKNSKKKKFDGDIRYIKSLIKSNKIEKAESKLEKIYQESSKAAIILGKLKYREKNYSLAFYYLKSGILKSGGYLPDDSEAFLMAGLSAQVIGKIDDARYFLKMASEQDKKSPMPTLALGNLERFAKRYQEAKKFYIETLKRNSNLVEAHLGMADCLFALGDEKESVKTYTYILKKYPGKVDDVCYLGLSRLLLKQKHYREALKMIEKADKKSKKNPQIYEMKAYIFTLMGRKKRAEEEYRKLLKYDPSNVEARSWLVEYYSKKRDFVSAREELKRALKVDPENGKFNYLLAVLYSGEKNYKLSEKYFKLSLSYGFNKLEVLMALAILKEKENKKIEAIGYYQKAYEYAQQINDKKYSSLLSARIKKIGGKLWKKRKKKKKKKKRNYKPDYLKELM